MSAALQLPMVWGASNAQLAVQEIHSRWQQQPAEQPRVSPPAKTAVPDISMAFYRKHTESLLRRYLYASMLVGRTPSILGDPVARGWASSRPVRTFEDAIIFVLDVERCLAQLGSLERQLLSRIVLQEYTQAETASLLGMCVRTVSYKFPQALDRLTEKLLTTGLLVLPH
jgi:hypothetical protein